MLKFLQDKLQPPGPSIDSYGQIESELPEPTIQAIMEWLGLSLYQAGYRAKSHLFWFTSESLVWQRQLHRVVRRGEPVFLYQCGQVRSHPPDGYYWRLMPEHESLRLYQLEEQDDNCA